MTGLIGNFDRVTGAFNQTTAIICQSQILLALAVGDVESVGCKGDGDDENFNRAICIMLNCLTREKLQGFT